MDISYKKKFSSPLDNVYIASPFDCLQKSLRLMGCVSDHMYRMAMMTMLLEDKELDTARCMKIAIVHDLAECIVGDITPLCGVSQEEKHQREKDAMEKLCGLVNNPKVATEIMDLWKEYSSQLTQEAKTVKDLDRFEMILQAFEYEKAEHRPGDLQVFFN